LAKCMAVFVFKLSSPCGWSIKRLPCSRTAESLSSLRVPQYDLLIAADLCSVLECRNPVGHLVQELIVGLLSRLCSFALSLLLLTRSNRPRLRRSLTALCGLPTASSHIWDGFGEILYGHLQKGVKNLEAMK
jgi:hypothetical protein